MRMYGIVLHRRRSKCENVLGTEKHYINTGCRCTYLSARSTIFLHTYRVDAMNSRHVVGPLYLDHATFRVFIVSILCHEPYLQLQYR